MPFRRRPSRWAHVRKRRAGAASTLQSAWRRRRRRRAGGLVAKTARSNMRKLKMLKGSVEVKEENTNVASLNTEFAEGQANVVAIVVDHFGTMTNMQPAIPDTFACNLLKFNGGVGENEYIGKQITLRSVAVKCQIEHDNRSSRSVYHLYLIHDNQPDDAPLNLHDEILKLPATGQVPAPYGLSLAFHNKTNVGKGKRVQILDHKRVVISAPTYTHNGQTVPAIVTNPGGTAPDTYGNTTRLQYIDLNSSSNCVSGDSAAEVTLFTKAPYRLEFDENAAGQTAKNHAIYLYAYQYGLGGYVQDTQPNCSLMFRANIRFTDL